MDQTRLNQLVGKYQEGRLSSSEAEELDHWFHSLNLTDLDFDQWISDAGGESQMAENLFDDFNNRFVHTKSAIKVRRLRWSIVAASVLILMSAGTIFLLKTKHLKQQLITQGQKQDILPGGNKAVLTLANGKKISLTDASTGAVAQQANMQISKTANGKIVYLVNNAASSLASSKAIGLAYNTVETPRGGQTSITLSDGTIAYLDAASSIKFPVQFKGSERKVFVTGQVYFEVVHNDQKPFRVMVKDQTIEDIGTHFNVNAYDDEPNLKITLAEGKVSVKSKDQFKILRPGQAAITSYSNPRMIVAEADVEETLAWKNGLFIFNEETLQSEMREISRWYNVEFVYPAGQMIAGGFGGSVTRFGNISEVLKMLEITGDYRFQIDGKKIIVTKKNPNN